jgi:hypothetical protein
VFFCKNIHEINEFTVINFTIRVDYYENSDG